MAALRTVALTTTPITDLVQQRVYVGEIPREIVEAEDPRQPKKMLVLRQGGGGAKADLMPIMSPTIIALCYGETVTEVDRVRRAVAQRFLLLEREIHDDVLIHHINQTSDAIPSVEADLKWPAVAQTYNVLADLLEVA